MNHCEHDCALDGASLNRNSFYCVAARFPFNSALHLATRISERCAPEMCASPALTGIASKHDALQGYIENVRALGNVQGRR
jgi:hypothetical protein